MFVFAAKKRRRYAIGGGFLDLVGRAFGSAGTFLSANKDTIKNAADVIGSVAKAGATTASAVKQIVDIVKAKRAAAATAALPKPVEHALSQKSLDFLQQLASKPKEDGRVAAPIDDINSRIAGAGFKTLRKSRRQAVSKANVRLPSN
jgi:hypothetical protein